jgi:hypothetical protein
MVMNDDICMFQTLDEADVICRSNNLNDGRIFSRVAEVLYNRLLPRFEPGGLSHVGGMLQLSWRVGATLEVFSTRKIVGRLGRWGVLLAGGADRRCHSVTESQSHSELGAWRGTRAFHASFLTYCTLCETRFESLGGLRQYEVLGRHPTREASTLPLVKHSIDGGQTSG